MSTQAKASGRAKAARKIAPQAAAKPKVAAKAKPQAATKPRTVAKPLPTFSVTTQPKATAKASSAVRTTGKARAAAKAKPQAAAKASSVVRTTAKPRAVAKAKPQAATKASSVVRTTGKASRKVTPQAAAKPRDVAKAKLQATAKASSAVRTTAKPRAVAKAKPQAATKPRAVAKPLPTFSVTTQPKATAKASSAVRTTGKARAAAKAKPQAAAKASSVVRTTGKASRKVTPQAAAKPRAVAKAKPQAATKASSAVRTTGKASRKVTPQAAAKPHAVAKAKPQAAAKPRTVAKPLPTFSVTTQPEATAATAATAATPAPSDHHPDLHAEAPMTAASVYVPPSFGRVSSARRGAKPATNKRPSSEHRREVAPAVASPSAHEVSSGPRASEGGSGPRASEGGSGPRASDSADTPVTTPRPLPTGVKRRGGDTELTRSAGYSGQRGASPPSAFTSRVESSFDLTPFHASSPRPTSPAAQALAIDRTAARLGREVTPEQRRLISVALAGRDTLTLLPAGSGQVGSALITASLMEHPALVVHPSSTWLKVHQEQLTARGVPSVRLDGTLSGDERRRALERVRFARGLVVLITPRLLQRADVCRALGQASVSLAVLMEAQLFSEFSPDFAPSSACLDDLLGVLGRPVVMAFSQVASAAVRSDLIDGLRLRDPALFEAPLVRENVKLQALRCEPAERRRTLVSELSALEPPGIVVCTSPREVEAVHQALSALDIKSYRYHHQMAPQARIAEQLAFAHHGRRAVMVAESGYVGLTPPSAEERSAPRGYGLGPCRADIRYVLHFHAPASLEQYVRDVGLAGRDGAPAHAVMLFNPNDLECYPARPSLTSLTTLLELLQRHGDTPLTVSALASLMSTPEESTAELIETLVDAGLVVRAGGWVRPALSAAHLMKRGEFLLDQLETLGERDLERRAQVQAYASPGPESGCRLASLHQHLGLPEEEPCGACDHCEMSGTSGRSTRRATQRRFEVAIERQGVQLTTAGEPLGFKLRAAAHRPR